MGDCLDCATPQQWILCTLWFCGCMKAGLLSVLRFRTHLLAGRHYPLALSTRFNWIDMIGSQARYFHNTDWRSVEGEKCRQCINQESGHSLAALCHKCYNKITAVISKWYFSSAQSCSEIVFFFCHLRPSSAATQRRKVISKYGSRLFWYLWIAYCLTN